MLALRMRRQGQCPGCGGDLAETTKPEHEERYQAELPLQCHRCVAILRDHDRYRDAPYPRSLLHLVPHQP